MYLIRISLSFTSISLYTISCSSSILVLISILYHHSVTTMISTTCYSVISTSYSRDYWALLYRTSHWLPFMIDTKYCLVIHYDTTALLLVMITVQLVYICILSVVSVSHSLYTYSLLYLWYYSGLYPLSYTTICIV